MITRLWNQTRQTELARHGFLLFLVLRLANLSNLTVESVDSAAWAPRLLARRCSNEHHPSVLVPEI